VFRQHYRRSRFADFNNWNDYRFEGPFRPRVRAHGWGYRRRRHPLLRFLILVAIVWAVARLVRGRRYSGWF